jgi:hypothetical protein
MGFRMKRRDEKPVTLTQRGQESHPDLPTTILN